MPHDARRAVFIYYKVEPAQALGLLDAVRRMQAALCDAFPGLHARLWTRGQGQGEPPTWMESYEHAQGVDEDVQARIEQHARQLPTGRQGERHVEVFWNVGQG